MTADGGTPTDATYQAALLRARAALDASGTRRPGSGAADPRPSVRRPVLDSWRRCLQAPLGFGTRPPVSGERLLGARQQHPFQRSLPMLRSRLIDPAVEAGLMVALGDAQGRLLWVEGRGRDRDRAEAMGFAVGTDWSEAAMGTSAPALALRSTAPAQVVGAEHFREAVHPFSCSAVPVLDPRTGRPIGVLDVTGGTDAVGPLVLPLLRAAAQAVQEALAAQHPAPDPEEDGTGPLLRLTGEDGPALRWAGRATRLGGRHAELLHLLSLHPEGLSAAELAEAVHGRLAAEGTVRAELVRLRRALEGIDGGRHGLVVDSRPYRLRGEHHSDYGHVREALFAGDVARALAHYRGPLLPDSEAPVIRADRERTRAMLRELVLTAATPDQLWAYSRLPEAQHDREVLMTFLQLAAPDAPERAAAVARVELLD